jgi:hypothetical protein
MRVLQRASAIISWFTVLAVGVLLVLESTDLISSSWRRSLADLADWLVSPSLARWSAALLGAGLALLAFILLAAQLVPYRLSARPTIVDKSPKGTTSVGAAAQRRGVIEQLLTVPGVQDAIPISHRRRIKIQAQLADDSHVADVRQKAREVLNDEFWSGLGIDPTPVDLILVLGNSPTKLPVLQRESQETT